MHGKREKGDEVGIVNGHMSNGWRAHDKAYFDKDI